METFHFGVYLSKIQSLLTVVRACNQLEDTNTGMLIDDMLQRLITLTDADDVSINRKIEAQKIFIALLENLHLHHRTVQTNYYLTEFTAILQATSPSIDLRKVV
jgi:hypothetical protein